MTGIASAVRAVLGRLGSPAVGVAVVTAGDVRVAVAGERVRGGGVPVADGVPWHIGSCAKAMTAAVVGLLAERGEARWDTPLPEALPDLAAGMHDGWREVTVGDLLLHRSGLPANPARRWLRDGRADTRPLPDQRSAAAREALADAPASPGAFRYSNLGYVVAGAVVDRLAGRPYEDALSAGLLGPLGVTTAGFGAPGGDAPWGHRRRFLLFGRGPGVDPASPLADNPPVLGPAGRLHVSLRDWALFVREFLDGGSRVLSSETVAHLLTVPPGDGPRQAMGWAFPDTTGRGPGFAFGQQGSNLLWSATAVVAAGRGRAALVVANDGRPRVLRGTAAVAMELAAG